MSTAARKEAYGKEIYRVWLKNLAKLDESWNATVISEVGTVLLTYFSQIVVRSSQFCFVDLSWHPTAGIVKGHELLVYLVPSRSASIIGPHTRDPLGPTGTTFSSRKGMISEVYLDTLKESAEAAKLIANITFHHLMHNKLEPAVVKNIHTLGGGGLAVESPLSGAHRPTPENLNLMAKGLGRMNPQYLAAL